MPALHASFAPVLMYFGAAVFFVLACWLLWDVRQLAGLDNDEPDSAVEAPTNAPTHRARAWRDTLTLPTRLVLGISAFVIAYHLVAWALPGDHLPIPFPAERWWILPGLVLVMISGSTWADRIEARRSG